MSADRGREVMSADGNDDESGLPEQSQHDSNSICVKIRRVNRASQSVGESSEVSSSWRDNKETFKVHRSQRKENSAGPLDLKEPVVSKVANAWSSLALPELVELTSQEGSP